MILTVQNGSECQNFDLHSITVDTKEGISFFCRDTVRNKWVTIRPPRIVVDNPSPQIELYAPRKFDIK